MVITIEQFKNIIRKHNEAYLKPLEKYDIILVEYLDNDLRYDTWSIRFLAEPDILIHIRPIGNLLKFDYQS